MPPAHLVSDAEVAEQIAKLAEAARNQNFEGLRLARIALAAIRAVPTRPATVDAAREVA